jgi:hypothetical protein
LFVTFLRPHNDKSFYLEGAQLHRKCRRICQIWLYAGLNAMGIFDDDDDDTWTVSASYFVLRYSSQQRGWIFLISAVHICF